jgi:hypothetical protein
VVVQGSIPRDATRALQKSSNLAPVSGPEQTYDGRSREPSEDTGGKNGRDRDVNDSSADHPNRNGGADEREPDPEGDA